MNARPIMDDVIDRSHHTVGASAASEFFRRQWNSARQRFLHVEVLQTYDEPDDPAHQLYRQGKYRAASEQLASQVRGQVEMFRGAASRGVEVSRLRIYDLPLSNYLAYYELPSYLVSQSLGETISVAPRQDAPDDLIDCLLFDQTAVIVPEYSSSGERVGSWLSEDPALAKRLGAAAAAAGSRSRAFTAEILAELGGHDVFLD